MVTELTYDEVKDLHAQDVKPNEIVEEISEFITEEQIKEIIKSVDYKSYSGKTPLQVVIDRSESKKKGNLRNKLEERKEVVTYEPKDSASLMETISTLQAMVRGLFKMISFLQKRKENLEKEILFMEAYLEKGIEIAEEIIEK